MKGQGNKLKKNFMQLGRSMVEMLGVLALIGVLSIVGVQGYKKAMLHHYANEAMDSAQRFYAFVEEYVTLNPGKKGKNIYFRNGTTNDNDTYLNTQDFMPAFAKSDFGNFSIVIKIPASGTRSVLIYNIRKSGLCSTLFPNGTKKKWSKDYTADNLIDQTIGDTLWRCRTAVSNNTPVCDL